MKLLRRGLVGLLVAALVVYGGFLAALFLLQRQFQYEPDGVVQDLTATALAGAEAVVIPVGEGAELHGWYQAPQPGQPVILYYKGNAGSFTAEHERYEAFVADGYGFLAFDYRGFPASPGVISQANILSDALAAYDWVSTAGLPIVIWGRSLGSGPATYVASEREADALLLETPFLSALTVAAERYPFAPVAWLMQDQFPSNSWIGAVAAPIFVAHGTADTVIDVTNGERLYALAPQKHGLWIVPEGTHGDLWDRGLWAHARAFFAAEAGKG